MDKNTTIEILEALASGYSPKTGEMLPDESVLNEREVIRALQIAIDELKKDLVNKVAQKKQKDEKYKEIDYFKTVIFNTLTEAAIEKLKVRIETLGIQKTENLSENILKARVLYPRAYEPWSSEEKELLTKAIEYTNDLEILSECFQRGKGSIETFGQKIIYKSK
jgi:hypothetical protein